MRSLVTISLLAGCCPVVAHAQDAGQVLAPAVAPEDDDEDGQGQYGGAEEIVVRAGRLRGEIDVPQQPVAVFEEEDIAAYGVASISELLEAISPQTGSGRGRGGGRPVILLNGQRVSSFREMRSIPPEAIRRMQVLPEEVALRFGYPPNQRVVNIILKDKFASKQIAGEFNYPTRGGYSNYEVEGSLFRVDGQRRTTLEAKIVETSLLTEAERDVIQEPGTVPTIPGAPDPADNRSLVSASREITLGGTSAMGLGEDGLGGSLTVNGAYTRTDTRSLSGLDTVLLTADGATVRRSLEGPLRSRVGTDAFQGGLAYNKALGGWQLTGTVDASYTDATTKVDRRRDLQALIDAAAAGTLPIMGPLPPVAGAGYDTARSKDVGVSSLVTVAGNLLRLPAGEIAATFRTGFDYSRSDNEDTRDLNGSVVLDRSEFSAGVNLALPLTSRREDVLSAVGDIALNLSGGVDHLSDFGTLTEWSAGFTWAPTEKLSFQASYIVNEAAPSLSQLASPQVLAFNVPTFDFVRGETALVTLVSGGNPDLLAERQRDIKLALNWELPILDRSNLVIEYFRNRSTDVTQSFPLLTPAVEAAFPGRVTRDGAGRLMAIDRRPVTFNEIASSRMRWGLNFGGSLGSSANAAAAGAPAAARRPSSPTTGGRPAARSTAGEEPQPGADRASSRAERPGGPSGAPERASRGGAEPAGVGPMRRGRQGGRWNVAVYHTWRFTDTIRIAPGVEQLDQLQGDAISAGGVPRHAIEFEGGVFRNGYGLRLQGEWNAPARVNGSGLPGSSDLRFGSTFDVGLRMFVDLGQQQSLVQSVPFLKNTRVSLTVDNLFDQRQRVTDEDGNVPLAYQAAYREPQGRIVGIDLRKMF
ncbi:TonB-dependent receptor domain-containing protein [Novosphingobium sp. M1R2S20]|uniref:TonB-dependent receptor n=1 Tax=Novosphingobium rhizovicinum TaxID=3228928 RepID=A0ABV3R6C2_9SPHN